MRKALFVATRIASALALTTCLAVIAIASMDVPLALISAKVTIDGTTNLHPYSASTATVRVTRAHLSPAPAGTEFWENALKPGVVDVFEIAIPATSLSSPKEGVDKNMYKALKTEQYPDITFRLARFEARDNVPGPRRAIGVLTIAGVEREVTLLITTKRTGGTLSVHGSLDLLMTDYGVTPPKAMLGMLKTDPKVTVTFDTVLSIPLM